MLLYNTTYQIENGEARQLVTWLHECYMPKVEDSEMLRKPRLSRVLSHHDQDSECFALEFQVEDTATLHHWYTQHGMELEKELRRMFGKKVVWFSTLLELIE